MIHKDASRVLILILVVDNPINATSSSTTLGPIYLTKENQSLLAGSWPCPISHQHRLDRWDPPVPNRGNFHRPALGTESPRTVLFMRGTALTWLCKRLSRLWGNHKITMVSIWACKGSWPQHTITCCSHTRSREVETRRSGRGDNPRPVSRVTHPTCPSCLTCPIIPSLPCDYI